MSKIIELKGITKSFKRNLALEGLDMTINKGEHVTIIGSNGAGKTTLFKIIAGLLKADEGDANINGKVSMQFQEFDSDMTLLVKDFIDISMDISDIKWNDDIQKIYLDLGIEQYEKTKMSKISVGERQRVNFFLAFIEDTDILLIDEFSSGLDLASRLKIKELILSDKKRTIISITHQPEEIKELSDRVLVLKAGKIVSDEKVSEIEKRHKGNFNEFMSKYIN